ncbi:hypothetical protein C4566_01180 [Candidatus Parcubacteria bacterium]|nr:MAG: hypothetical protein C4566_01180 [Candidatus Parcubacteria bacterium]
MTPGNVLIRTVAHLAGAGHLDVRIAVSVLHREDEIDQIAVAHEVVRQASEVQLIGIDGAEERRRIGVEQVAGVAIIQEEGRHVAVVFDDHLDALGIATAGQVDRHDHVASLGNEALVDGEEVDLGLVGRREALVRRQDRSDAVATVAAGENGECAQKKHDGGDDSSHDMFPFQKTIVSPPS